MRLVLAFLLLSGALPSRAADAPPDPLAVIITQLAAPLDEQAESASAPKAENSERLAKIQSSLTVAAAGFESLRSPAHAFAAKEALEAKTDPALKPFIKNRDASLNAIYRTLAVVDYTWALRFPNPACSPTERRRALLQSADGLFIDPDVATLSPWMARLLGPNSFGRAPEEALDRAAAATKLTASAYEKVRVRASQITETIGAAPAGGRAALYCERAGLYEQLANAHRAESGPTLAALATGSDNAASAAGSVFLVAAPNGNDYDALGAGFLVATKNGQKFVTDASIVRGRKKIYAFAHPASDGKLGRPMAVTIEHAAKGTGPAVGRFDGQDDFSALALSVASPAADELVRGLGPLREAGPWTVTQGLVTGISATTFQSDAVLSAEMAGAPVLNDRGEAAGLIIRNGGDATALKVEDLRDFLDAEKPEASDAEFVASRNSGSASLLTTMRPVEAYGWSAPGASAIESGLPGNLGGVNWDGGGGVGGFRPNAPATPSYSYNWQKSTGYSDGGSAERIGNSIGAPLGDAVGKLLVFGMQKLFRGIYSIFHPQPGSGGSDGAVAQVKREKPAPPPPPPPPPPEPKITGLTVSVSPADALPGQRVTVTGQLQFQGDYKNKSGITISFGADGKRAFFGDAGGSSAKGTTDSGGHASVVLTLAEDVQRTASAEFDSLDRETSHQRNANPAPHAVANATPTRKVKDAASAAVGALEAESDQDFSSPEPDAQADETEPEDSPATIEASPISVTASALKFSASAQIKTAAKPYYKLVIKAAPNKINSGDHATVTARIITNDKNFVKSGVPINFEFTMNGAQAITATVNTNNSGIAEIDVESVGQSLNVAASAGGTANAPTEAGDKFNSPICTLFGAATIAIQATPAVLAASAAGAAAAPVALAAAAPVILPALGAGLVVMTGCYVLINGVPQKPQPMASNDNASPPNGGGDAIQGQTGDPNQHLPPEEDPKDKKKARLSQKDLEHIIDRHWPDSEFIDSGKFAEGTSEHDLIEMLDEATENGTERMNTRGRPGKIVEYDFKKNIGVNSNGDPTSRLRVIVQPDGSVKTAFPY